MAFAHSSIGLFDGFACTIPTEGPSFITFVPFVAHRIPACGIIAPGSSAGLISASGFACFNIFFREVCISCSSSSPADVSFEEYDLPSTPSPCRRLSHPQSTMGRSEFPVPCSTPTLRLAVPTCFAGGKGHSQVLVRFSSSMPHSLTPVESTRAHHITLFMLASVTLTTSPSTFYAFNGAESSQEVRSSLRPTEFAVYASP